jgi:hypothetical protein
MNLKIYKTHIILKNRESFNENNNYTFQDPSKQNVNAKKFMKK